MRLQMNQKLNCIRDWKSFTCRLVLLKYEEDVFFVSFSAYVAFFLLIRLISRASIFKGTLFGAWRDILSQDPNKLK
jgi:hypothetical protein